MELAPLLAAGETADRRAIACGMLLLLATLPDHTRKWRRDRSVVGARCPGLEGAEHHVGGHFAGLVALRPRQGHGGARSAVREVRAHLPINRFVLRTDVKSYYASIDHVLLMDRLAQFVRDPIVLNLCGQYLKRTAERAGGFGATTGDFRWAAP